MKGTHRIVMTVPAKPEYVGICRLALAGIARTTDMSPTTLADLKLALTEVVNNAVDHGAASAESDVSVAFELAPTRIHVEVEDDGAGFDTELLKGPDPEAPSESGMGMMILRALVDDLAGAPRQGGRGMRVEFSKSLP